MKKRNKHIEAPVKHESEKHVNERRRFLKKVTYKAPALILLGQLAKPEKAHADGSQPDGPPNGNGWGGFG